MTFFINKRAKPTHGEIRVRRRFAWLPIKLYDNRQHTCYAWLQGYWEVQKYRVPESKSMAESWITINVTCSRESPASWHGGTK